MDGFTTSLPLGAQPPGMVQPWGKSIVPMPQELLDILSKDHLEIMARYHHDIARQLSFRAAEIARRKKQTATIKREVQTLREAGKLVIKYLATGLTYDGAVRAAVATSGIDTNCIEENFRQEIKKNKYEANKSRELAIIRMARNGKTNNQIAERLGVHRNTVSRVIRKALNHE